MPIRCAEKEREVYFVRAKRLKLIKIGSANDVYVRLRSLQADSPDDLRLVGAIMCLRWGALEAELHERFAHLRVRGEWYRRAPELLAYIRANRQSLARRHGLALESVIRGDSEPRPRIPRMARRGVTRSRNQSGQYTSV